MPQSLSPKKNWRLISEAYFGTPRARALHARYLANPITVEAGLDVIRTRWPDARSTNTSKPIFIFSAGWRSGSTYLQRLLMRDTDTIIWGEPYRHAEVVDSLARQVKAFTHIWPSDRFFIGADCDINALSEQWVANLYPGMADFLAGHLAFFDRLFAEPARARGRTRWGFKEVALSVGHACYLRWVFPQAKFIFLYRNPYDAYQSYRKWRDWYRSWPHEPVFTPARFGRFWKDLAADFIANYTKVGGLLLKYEDLHTVDAWKRMEQHLEMSLASPESIRRVNSSAIQHKPGLRVPRFERYLLRRQVEPLGSRLGYTQ